MEKIDIIEFITTVRSSFGASIAIYTTGNCYQFYEILKVVFPKSEPYESGGHVITKIDDKFYDIRGEVDVTNINAIPVSDDRIESLSKNKWTDERRMLHNEEYRNELLSRNSNRKIKDIININETGKIIIKEDKI